MKIPSNRCEISLFGWGRFFAPSDQTSHGTTLLRTCCRRSVTCNELVASLVHSLPRSTVCTLTIPFAHTLSLCTSVSLYLCITNQKLMVAMNLMTVLGSLCALGLLALPGALGVQDPEDFVNLLAGSFTDGRSYSSELLIMLQLLLYRDSRSSLLCLCMCVCDCSRKHPAADRTTLGCVAPRDVLCDECSR